METGDRQALTLREKINLSPLHPGGSDPSTIASTCAANSFVPELEPVADCQRWTVGGDQSRPVPDIPFPSPRPWPPQLLNDNYLFENNRKRKFRLFRAQNRMIPPRRPPPCSQMSPLCGSLADTPILFPEPDTTNSQQVQVNELSLALRNGMAMDEEVPDTANLKWIRLMRQGFAMWRKSCIEACKRVR